MTTWEFPCSGPATITIGSWRSGSVAVSGEQADVIAVEVTATRPGANVEDLLSEVRVSFDDGRLSIKGPRSNDFRRRQGLDLTIKAPAGSVIEANTASADVACVGELSDLTINTASGDVTVAAASGALTVQTASGDVFVDRADADVRIATASGDVQVAHAGGEVRVDTASGDLTVGDSTGPVIAHTASGDIDVKRLAGRADLRSLSGDVHVTVAPGIDVYLDLSTTSGSVRSDLDEAGGDGAAPEAPIEVKCRSISGDIRIGKASSAAA
jgi:DUF4097 and DUF4098 domain-containing protein YvlB